MADHISIQIMFYPASGEVSVNHPAHLLNTVQILNAAAHNVLAKMASEAMGHEYDEGGPAVHVAGEGDMRALPRTNGSA